MDNRHMKKQNKTKKLSITNHQGKANQNHSVMSPHTCQNGHHKKTTNNKFWPGCGEEGALLHHW